MYLIQSRKCIEKFVLGYTSIKRLGFIILNKYIYSLKHPKYKINPIKRYLYGAKKKYEEIKN